MIQLKNTTDKQTFHIPRTVMKTEFVSGTEAKDVSITENGTYQILPSKGKKALSAVNLNVNVEHKLDPSNTPFLVPEGMKFTKSTLERFPDKWIWSDTANWTDFKFLFSECKNLKEIPRIEIDNAETLESLFEYSGDGTVDLDLSHWKTTKNPNVDFMFENANFKSVKFSKDFKLNDINYMFYYYDGKKLDLSDWDMSEITTIQYTFYNTELEELTIGYTPKLRSLRHSFSLSDKLRKLNTVQCADIWDTSDAFKGLTALRDFGGFKDLNSSIDIVECPSLSYESLINILNGLKPVTSSKYIRFDQDNVNMLTDDDIAIATSKGWSVSPARSVTEKITVTDLNQLPTSLLRIHPRVYDLSSFTGKWGDESTQKSNIPCYRNLYNIEISLKSTTDASYIFANGYSRFILISDTSNVKSLKGAFYNASFLRSITMIDDVSNVEDVTDMFKNCSGGGTFYYNPAYDYSKIIEVLPTSWTAKPIE